MSRALSINSLWTLRAVVRVMEVRLVSVLHMLIGDIIQLHVNWA